MRKLILFVGAVLFVSIPALAKPKKAIFSGTCESVLTKFEAQGALLKLATERPDPKAMVLNVVKGESFAKAHLVPLGGWFYHQKQGELVFEQTSTASCTVSAVGSPAEELLKKQAIK